MNLHGEKSTEFKVRTYKFTRFSITYALETRGDTKKTNAIATTTEMWILRNIIGFTTRDRNRNNEIRICNTQDVIKWNRKWRREWTRHNSRMRTTELTRKHATACKKEHDPLEDFKTMERLKFKVIRKNKPVARNTKKKKKKKRGNFCFLKSQYLLHYPYQ